MTDASLYVGPVVLHWEEPQLGLTATAENGPMPCAVKLRREYPTLREALLAYCDLSVFERAMARVEDVLTGSTIRTAEQLRSVDRDVISATPRKGARPY